MEFSGRSRELGRLRGLLDRAEPQVVRITGLAGVGKSALVRRAAADYPGLILRCDPLPAPAQRARVQAKVEDACRRAGVSGPPTDAAWSELLSALTACAAKSARPFVFVLDDAHRLQEARSRFAEPLRMALSRAATEGVRLHLILIGRASTLPNVEEVEGVVQSTLTVEPLPLRAAASHLPGSQAHEQVRAYGVFGGIPRVLAALDTSVTVGTNVRRLLLDDAGSLSDAPLSWLEREVQTPSRYVAILSALATGDADWATLHAGVPDLTRSGQVAPYLNRLTELGLIEPRRSLDAGPRARATRYAVTDPFVAFWFRFVFPWYLSERVEEIGPHYARAIRPGISDHIESVLPRICRQHMALDAIETLGAVARESGSVWNRETEIPVAGTLTSGAAYYGSCHWTTPSSQSSPLDDLDAEVARTRYGFGREGRLRIIFTGRATSGGLRRDVARRHDAHIIDAEGLLGG